MGAPYKSIGYEISRLPYLRRGYTGVTKTWSDLRWIRRWFFFLCAVVFISFFSHVFFSLVKTFRTFILLVALPPLCFKKKLVKHNYFILLFFKGPKGSIISKKTRKAFSKNMRPSANFLLFLCFIFIFNFLILLSYKILRFFSSLPLFIKKSRKTQKLI